METMSPLVCRGGAGGEADPTNLVLNLYFLAHVHAALPPLEGQGGDEIPAWLLMEEFCRELTLRREEAGGGRDMWKGRGSHNIPGLAESPPSH